MKDNMTKKLTLKLFLKTLSITFLLILFFSVTLIFKTNSVYAQGSFTCSRGIEGNWSVSTQECDNGYTTQVNICQSECERIFTINTTFSSESYCSRQAANDFKTDCVVDPTYSDVVISRFDDANNGTDESTQTEIGVTKTDFDALNPLKIANKNPGVTVKEDLSTPGGIISRLLAFSFPIAGLILFVMLFWGGFEITYGASTSKSMEAGRNRITAALIGFFLLFASFWIIQILEEVLGIAIFL